MAYKKSQPFVKMSGRTSWYKEHLHKKSTRELKLREQIPIYETENWLFLKRGLDDFRDGLPPIGRKETLRTSISFGPALSKDFVTMNDLKNPAGLKRLSKYQTYLTRQTPQKQQQRKYVNSVEQGLLAHPLALYPHLEKSVAPEIFENILDLLDPQFSSQELQEEEMELLEGMEDDNDYDWSKLSSVSQPEMGKHKHEQTLGYEPSFRNMYKWLPPKENAKDSKKNKEKEKLWPTSQSEEEHIRQVTREFCDWVADLGGETNNIEESTITSLFASGYDTKPTLSVPIHVVDMANVPHELRLSAMVPPPPPPEKAVPVTEKQKKTIIGHYEPTFVKFRYGAWYLSPSTWKKRGYYEPLEDPKQLKQHEMSEAKKQCHELTEELATVHASKAFDEFITKKNTRKPEFLVDIAEIQKKAALEGEKRSLTEMMSNKSLGGPPSQIL